ncbi:hypothetical protein D6D01_01399 [Aureobasidium pullulans]|uniref:Uncharacterized protein n=1 Tax=Aureobasidium pullulans TaxID=5580 RepID=A0A4S9LZ48_AURPU|nr:hypothetical protein D6D01_01399 [Aureobasidium pullulans]
MPPYPGDPPEWRTFSGSYLDWQPSDEGSSTVTALTTENERLRAELAGVREELAAARGRADRRKGLKRRSRLFKPHTINIAAADKKKRSRPVTPCWR